MENQAHIVDSEALAEAIAVRRRIAGEKSLRQAASEIGVSFSTLSRVAAEKTPPDLTTYIKLCRWLAVPLEKFIRA